MDSFEINKIVAAILMVALLIIGIDKVSEIVFHIEKPKTPTFEANVPPIEMNVSLITMWSPAVTPEIVIPVPTRELFLINESTGINVSKNSCFC